MRDFKTLLEVVERLRGPDGCPWDKEQTHKSLTRFALEEAFELAEAIDQGQDAEMIEELGDLLLQVVLHSEIARQEKRFDVGDVVASISEKMIRRHPHVFGDQSVKNSEEVLKNWSEIKAREKAAKPKPRGFDVPEALPALVRAQKIGEKTRRQNFDWASPKEVMLKVEEELNEVKEAIQGGSREEVESEIGDLLFSVAQLARHLNCDPEQTLRRCNRRFEKRFFKMRELAEAEGVDFETLPAPQLESLWTRAKKLT
jgi:tetrapyrrole methylase family protein/MazG family protein